MPEPRPQYRHVLWRSQQKKVGAPPRGASGINWTGKEVDCTGRGPFPKGGERYALEHHLEVFQVRERGCQSACGVVLWLAGGDGGSD